MHCILVIIDSRDPMILQELQQIQHMGKCCWFIPYYFRIDKNNACRVVIDVYSFSTVEDGRSVYRKGRPLEWWVDSDEYSIIDMEKDVQQHFSWAINQEANF